MFFVIGIIVERSHRSVVLETDYQQTLVVEVGKAHRSVHLRHTVLFAPRFDCIEQSMRHVDIVDEIEPPEPKTFFIPSLIGYIVDNPRYTSYYFAVSVCQI